MAGIKRVVARRHKPTPIYSNNSSNLIDHKNERILFLKLLSDLKKNKINQDGVLWNLLLVITPQIGGFLGKHKEVRKALPKEH